jgi:hypothetical protein
LAVRLQLVRDIKLSVAVDAHRACFVVGAHVGSLVC